MKTVFEDDLAEGIILYNEKDFPTTLVWELVYHPQATFDDVLFERFKDHLAYIQD